MTIAKCYVYRFKAAINIWSGLKIEHFLKLNIKKFILNRKFAKIRIRLTLHKLQ